jgi:hypothetical protein
VLLIRAFSLLLPCAAGVLASAAPLVPSGTALEVRLRQAVASYSSKSGTPVEARVVAPVRLDERTMIPIGAWVRGELAEVRKVGLGLRRGRASLRFQFDTLELPDGTTFPLAARVADIDTARESVAPDGRILGIRATDAFGHRMAGITRNFFFWDPLVHSVLAGATAATIRFPESEIHFPAGTELRLVLTQPLQLREEWTVPLPAIATSVAERADLLEIVRDMTYRSLTSGLREADLINVVLLGEQDWLRRAFDAAGWVEADPLTKSTGWATFRSVAESKAYPEAPMSAQLLDELAPVIELSKALNTYSKRHHARVWSLPDSFRQRPVFALAATEDTAIDFSFKRMRLIHAIDPNLDNERAKIINDLVDAGCVDAAELVERPWAPREFRNATGEKVFTDSRLLVIELNPCRSPHTLRGDAHQQSLRVSGRWYQRIPRQVILTIRNDFTRNNPVFQAALGVRYLIGKAGGNQRRRARPARTSVGVLSVSSAAAPQ